MSVGERKFAEVGIVDNPYDVIEFYALEMAKLSVVICNSFIFNGKDGEMCSYDDYDALKECFISYVNKIVNEIDKLKSISKGENDVCRCTSCNNIVDIKSIDELQSKIQTTFTRKVPFVPLDFEFIRLGGDSLEYYRCEELVGIMETEHILLNCNEQTFYVLRSVIRCDDCLNNIPEYYLNECKRIVNLYCLDEYDINYMHSYYKKRNK